MGNDVHATLQPLKSANPIGTPVSARRRTGVIAGVLLLSTVAIPWGIYGQEPLWSWTIFQPTYAIPVKAALVGAWIAGLTSLIAAIFLSGAWLSRAYIAACLAALVPYLISAQGSLGAWRLFVPITPRCFTMNILPILILACFLIVARLLQSIPGPPLLRTLHKLLATVLGLVLCLAIFDHRDAIASLSQSHGIAAVLAAGQNALAALLAGLGVVRTFHQDRDGTSASDGRWVLWSLALLAAGAVLRPAIETGVASQVLFRLNSELLVVSISLLLIEGLAGILAPLFPLNPTVNEPRAATSARPLGLGVAVSVGVVLAGVAALAVLTRGNTTAASLADAQHPRTGDWAEWCGAPDHNVVSDEKNLPDCCDGVSSNTTSGLKNVRWVAPLDERTLGSPVIADGKVFIGGTLRTSSTSDNGVLWCFNAADGKLLWRMCSPYIRALYGSVSYGICSTPTVRDQRVYLIGHLGDVLCLNANGMAGGNTGPFIDESAYFASGRKCVKSEIAYDGSRRLECTRGEPAAPGALDADIVWRFDMLEQVRCWPFNALNSAPQLRGDRLFVATCSTLSGFDDGSREPIEAWKKKFEQKSYDSPSLIVLDAKTGKWLARSTEGSFDETFHGAHSTPTFGTVNGRELIFYGGGNGTCYAFDPAFAARADGKPAALKLVWKFNCLHPDSYGLDLRLQRPLRAETIATPVFYNNRIYTSIGNDLKYSGSQAALGRLVCIDATQSGDITATGRVWSFEDIRSTASTVAIADGLLYTADASGVVYCLDADTGKPFWTHATKPVWSSPLIADGKVYVGTHGAGLLVFAHSREKKLISQNLGNADIVAMPAAANGVLYVASQKHLYALETGRTGALVERPKE